MGQRAPMTASVHFVIAVGRTKEAQSVAWIPQQMNDLRHHNWAELHWYLV